eukprot:CAMPEP_0176481322 /NCGR_PEP_ID=MMETSP0200_2-20121128/2756_1 /TAXON_ID=947934 /ORGANISM="Chaetoceros sp., Strain GSL56" /LENGTH=152 /DNA_ID=CAMNT_0017877515 /DNA_START=215 /DNA_END=669 /DNA_ORIENTATION=-
MLSLSLLVKVLPLILIPSYGAAFTVFTNGGYSQKYNVRASHPLSSMIANDPGDGDTLHVPNILLVECGFGNDSHGQNATKAAIRACRNAIEFNSLSVKKMIPGGYEAMKLNVILAVPKKYQDTLDLNEVAKTFPYGDIKFIVQDGGMIAPSG